MFLPRTISIAIDKLARQTLGKDWSLYATLLDHWAEIVGPEYARVTTPVKITFPPRQQGAQRTGGTLTVRLPKGLTMEFTFKIGQMRERITSYFGYEAISKIVFEACYATPKEPAEEIEPDPAALARISQLAQEIDNDELREAVEAFGEVVLKSNQP